MTNNLNSEIPIVIMCGGRGTRMGDTRTKKELVDIGGKPLLWHVLNIFSAQGHNRFVLTLGHHADQVRSFFDDASLPREWHVSLIDTGLDTEKGSRLGRVRAELADAPRFLIAYGEAVANIDLAALFKHHQDENKVGTITGVQVNFQYGVIDIDLDGEVLGFVEKPKLPYWINGGFMLLEREALDLIPADRDDYNLETELLPHLAQQKQLTLYQHDDYWQSMKTLKDAQTLENDWQKAQPWRVW